MKKLILISDLHFFHKNIVKYTNRPQEFLEDLDGHNNWLINQINSVVTEDDEVYHLGDFAFSKDIEKIAGILMQLKGSWRMILGNHDNEEILNAACDLCNSRTGSTHKVLGNYHEMTYRKKHIVMFHFPIESWHKKRYGSLCLHGHLHGGKSKERSDNPMENRLDVGIDNSPHNLPFLLDDIIDGKYKHLEF